MLNFTQNYGVGLGATSWLHVFGAGLVLLIVWEIFWKGLALWHSSRRGEAWWFVILLLINTVGILEIIYLFFIAKKKISELFSK